MENIYSIRKNKKSASKRNKKTQIKEVKFRPGTEENDYQLNKKDY